MKILITGASGYLGSVVTRRLAQEGYDVTTVDQNPLPLGIETLSNVRFLQANVCFPETFEKAMMEAEVILPFAALVGTPLCDQKPELAWQTNYEAIEKLLKLKTPEQKLIFPMTNNMYAPAQDQQECDEETPTQALSLYTQSKLRAEKEVLNYPGTLSLRLASVFGVSPSMRWDVLVHDFTRLAVEDRSIELYESGFKRNFVHIEDVAEAFLFATQNFSKMQGKKFNVAGEFCNITKHELAKEIQKRLPSTEIRLQPAGRDPDQRNFFISTTRMKALGFEARRMLSETLPGIIECRKKIPTSQDLTAVILAGGEGTRLKSVLGDLPKVLAPVGGKPFITYLLDQLIEAGITKVVICTGYQAELVEQALGNHYRGLSIEYSREPEPLGTGGALRFALPKIKSEWVLAMNGDTYLERLFQQPSFKDRGNGEGLMIVACEDASRYGSVEMDSEGLLTRFREKEDRDNNGVSWINAGIYWLKRKTFERISAFQAVSLEWDFFPVLAREKKLKLFCLKGQLLDIGTPESLNQAENFFTVRDRSH